MDTTDQGNGGVTCLLCNARVSLRMGNFQKLNSHLEVNHDVFYEQDLLMALNFLEDHEREVIIEKVLPRMKLALDNAKNTDKGNKSKILSIDKRLSSEELSKENEEASTENTEEIEVEMDSLINLEEVVEEDVLNSPKRIKLDDTFEDEILAEALEVSLDEGEEEVLFNQNNTESAGDSDFVLEGNPEIEVLEKDVVVCTICNNKYKKRSMWNHTKRCELREKVRKLKEQNEAEKNLAKETDVKDESTTANGDNKEDNNEDTDRDNASNLLIQMTTCSICSKSFSSRGNLKKHIKYVHKVR